MRLRRLAVLAVPLLLTGACTPERDARPTVVVSVLPHRYVVERIAGDRVRVEVMIPPGASPATYEPSVAQLARLAEASLYVKVGHPNFPFEAAWLDRLLAEVPALQVVDAAEGLALREGDPHLWLAPRHTEHAAERVTAALAAILPEDADALQAELETFRREIAALDAEIRATLAPRVRHRFLVFHPAWGYFADAYDLEQVAIEREHKEPDPRELGELIARAREEGTQVVFVQPQFDPKSARTVASEIGARIEPLDPLAADWPDNLRRTANALARALSE